MICGRVNSGDDPSTSDQNLVSFCPATLELMRLNCVQQASINSRISSFFFVLFHLPLFSDWLKVLSHWIRHGTVCRGAVQCEKPSLFYGSSAKHCEHVCNVQDFCYNYLKHVVMAISLLISSPLVMTHFLPPLDPPIRSAQTSPTTQTDLL